MGVLVGGGGEGRKIGGGGEGGGAGFCRRRALPFPQIPVFYK